MGPLTRGLVITVFGLAITRPAMASPCTTVPWAAPLQRQFGTVLARCSAGPCRFGPAYEDARLDDLLFGSAPITPKRIRAAVAGRPLPPFLREATHAIRARRFGSAFAAYERDFVGSPSITREYGFLDSPSADAVREFLDAASRGHTSPALRMRLRAMCADPTTAGPVRLYDALDRLERGEVADAISELVTVPYIHAPSPEAHYDAVNIAALVQALDIDAATTQRRLAELRDRVRRHSPN
jgi:hypothetical protein